jgi:hypothetical protein
MRGESAKPLKSVLREVRKEKRSTVSQRGLQRDEMTVTEITDVELDQLNTIPPLQTIPAASPSAKAGDFPGCLCADVSL